MIYYNDHNAKTSEQVQEHQIPEIAGISEEDYQNQYNGDFEKLNADLYEFSFSGSPEYLTQEEKENVEFLMQNQGLDADAAKAHVIAERGRDGTEPIYFS